MMAILGASSSPEYCSASTQPASSAWPACGCPSRSRPMRRAAAVPVAVQSVDLLTVDHGWRPVPTTACRSGHAGDGAGNRCGGFRPQRRRQINQRVRHTWIRSSSVPLFNVAAPPVRALTVPTCCSVRAIDSADHGCSVRPAARQPIKAGSVNQTRPCPPATAPAPRADRRREPISTSVGALTNRLAKRAGCLLRRAACRLATCCIRAGQRTGR